MNIKDKLLWRFRVLTNPEFYKSELSFYRECDNLLKLNILESSKTIDFLLSNNHSFIRWGCGESAHFLGAQNPTQEYDKNLSQSLREIVLNYNNESNYLLGLPSIYI